MSVPKPPALATWLLEHLTIGPNKDAVTGDLLEQYARQPSPPWYWRQTLAAIALGLWKERRILWMASAGTVIWRMVLEQFDWRIWSFKEASGLTWGTSGFGFQSLFNVLPVLVVLPSYLAATRNFTLPMLRRGILVGLLALPVSFIPALALVSTVWRSLAPTREMAIQNPMLLPLLRVLNQTMNALPLFVALVLSMWAACTLSERSEALPTMEGEQA